VNPTSAAPRQLAVTSQFGTLSAWASFEKNHVQIEMAATAIIDCRDMTGSRTVMQRYVEIVAYERQAVALPARAQAFKAPLLR
jgi:hypothetical protein